LSNPESNVVDVIFCPTTNCPWSASGVHSHHQAYVMARHQRHCRYTREMATDAAADDTIEEDDGVLVRSKRGKKRKLSNANAMDVIFCPNVRCRLSIAGIPRHQQAAVLRRHMRMCRYTRADNAAADVVARPPQCGDFIFCTSSQCPWSDWALHRNKKAKQRRHTK
jgi:hypothetical protein